VTGGWRRLYNKGLSDLCSLPNQVKEDEMGGACSTSGLLVGKPEGKRPLGRPSWRWADNIKMDLRGIILVRVDWIGLGQDRDKWRALVNSVLNFEVP
jgi:hypothetical protein